MKTRATPVAGHVPWTLSRPLFALFFTWTCLAFSPVSSQAIIDLDADTLDDVWEEFFNAQTIAPGDDEDGDGDTNLEECLAGTDPFDAMDNISIGLEAPVITDASITFPTVNGKVYQVQLSASMAPGTFVNHGDPLHGTGAPITVNLSATGDDDLSGSATHEVWVGINGTDVGDLTGDANFPDNPDGTEALAKLQTASNIDDNFGGRIRGFIKPPANGSYNFYIASRHGGEFWLSTDETAGNRALIATVTTDAVAPEEWTHSPEQASPSISLEAGKKYYFEVLHQHGTDEDYCAVGWSGPGLPAGIQVVDGDYLCPIVATEPSTVDQIIHYPLEEGSGTTAIDAEGADHDGTVAGTAVWTAPDGGIIGRALTGRSQVLLGSSPKLKEARARP